MITKEQTEEIVKKFGHGTNDTGRTEVQVALLTKRIENLAPHFEVNKGDHHSKVGLLKMVGLRKSLLKYLSHKDGDRYKKLIAELGLRK
jgi:small subunit ribosomal protein S15